MRSKLVFRVLELQASLRASAQTLKRLQEGASCFVFLHCERSFFIHLFSNPATAELALLPQDGPGPVADLGSGQPQQLGEFLHSQRHPVNGRSIQVAHLRCMYRHLVMLQVWMKEEGVFKFLLNEVLYQVSQFFKSKL